MLKKTDNTLRLIIPAIMILGLALNKLNWMNIAFLFLIQSAIIGFFTLVESILLFDDVPMIKKLANLSFVFPLTFALVMQFFFLYWAAGFSYSYYVSTEFLNKAVISVTKPMTLIAAMFFIEKCVSLYGKYKVRHTFVDVSIRRELNSRILILHFTLLISVSVGIMYSFAVGKPFPGVLVGITLIVLTTVSDLRALLLEGKVLKRKL